MNLKSLNELDLLAALGVELHLDFDNSVSWEMPPVLDANKLDEYLQQHTRTLAEKVVWRHKGAQRRFYGGPMEGKPHGFGGNKHTHEHYISRARWAAYCCPDTWDGRFFYCGETTSEAKAKKLAWDTLHTKYKESLPKYLRPFKD